MDMGFDITVDSSSVTIGEGVGAGVVGLFLASALRASVGMTVSSLSSSVSSFLLVDDEADITVRLGALSFSPLLLCTTGTSLSRSWLPRSATFFRSLSLLSLSLSSLLFLRRSGSFSFSFGGAAARSLGMTVSSLSSSVSSTTGAVGAGVVGVGVGVALGLGLGAAVGVGLGVICVAAVLSFVSRDVDVSFAISVFVSRSFGGSPSFFTALTFGLLGGLAGGNFLSPEGGIGAGRRGTGCALGGLLAVGWEGAGVASGLGAGVLSVGVAAGRDEEGGCTGPLVVGTSIG